MKLVITESQLSNLVVDIHEDRGDNILHRDGYILHGGWKEKDMDKYDRIYKKMRNIYIGLRKGDGEIVIFNKEFYPPIQASYVLPPLDKAEFMIGFPRAEWDRRSTDNPDGSSMSININKKEMRWTIHNIEDYARARNNNGFTEEELIDWAGYDMVKKLISPRFANFNVNLY